MKSSDPHSEHEAPAKSAAANQNRTAAVKLLLGLAIQWVLLFGSAGTIRWTEGWILFITSCTYSLLVTVWLRKHNPALLKERLTLWKSTAYTWDRIIMVAGIPAYLALFSLPGLDAVRLRWSTVPLVLKGSGFGCYLASMLLIFRVMKENTFLSRIVEIQEDRGHKVISSGPYEYVRHPMYAAAIVSFFSLSLALGSWSGLIPAAALSALIVIRTRFEDLLLRKELSGYPEYAAKVRYRLVPGVW